MCTLQHNLSLPGLPLARMVTSMLPFLAMATPAMLLAMDPVTNTATVAAPAGAHDANTANNSVTLETARKAVIIAMPDEALEISTLRGGAAVVSVFAGDTLDGAPATRENTVVSLASLDTGASAGEVMTPAGLPEGITFDPATGEVSVAPGTPEGTYSFDYRICEIADPENCAISTVTLEIVIPPASISGTVFLDSNANRNLDPGDPLLGGWIVELVWGGGVIATTRTADNGFYMIEGLSSGTEYTIRFRDPETGVLYRQIDDVSIDRATTLPDQNLPIDPSGVVYDSMTRAPIADATVTLVDLQGVKLPTECYLDPSQDNQVTGASGYYHFDIVPGAAPACPLSETEYRLRVIPPAGYSFVSTVLPPQDGPLDPTGLAAPVAVSPSSDAPTESDPVYYLSFRLASGDPDVIDNHVPLDPFLTRSGLVVTKTSPRRSASTGDLIPYEITVRNTENARRADVDVIDVLPHGLTYVTGTARVNGVASEPQFTNGNRELVWPGQIIPANSEVTYELVLVVGAGVSEGQAVNTGLAENGADGSEISNRGTATVAIVPSTVFDCSELIGQVFEDYNGNGYQDDGEPGIPSIRLVTVNGEIITSDEHGRYHIACAAVPDARIGSNFVLEVDEASLPQGWAMTTDNPRSVRLTRGMMGVLNFGASESELVRLDIGANAFDAQGDLTPGVLSRLRALAAGENGNVVVRATYAMAPGEDAARVSARLSTIRAALQGVFAQNREGPLPTIQVDASSAQSAAGGE